MFMKKRQYAQVLAKAHGLLEHIEKTDSESGYSSDHDSDGERELVIAEVEEEAAPSNVEAHFSFKFSSDNELVMEEVAVCLCTIIPFFLYNIYRSQSIN